MRRILDDAMARVFLPGIGFRQSGVRLVEPVHSEASGLTLTLRDLIASPDGTELAYDITYNDEGGDVRAREWIVIRRGVREYQVASSAATGTTSHLRSSPAGGRTRSRDDNATCAASGSNALTLAGDTVVMRGVAVDTAVGAPSAE